jgi:hypothetical protein
MIIGQTIRAPREMLWICGLLGEGRMGEGRDERIVRGRMVQEAAMEPVGLIATYLESDQM